MLNQCTQESVCADFHRDGYVALRGFLSREEFDELLENMKRFKSTGVQEMPREHVFYEDVDRPETLKQLQRLHEYDDYFSGLFLDSKFERLAEQLLEGSVVGKNMQYFNKPPGIGQPTPAHQDGFYFMLDPGEAVTMWLALEDVDEENGCIRYVPGSHRDGMRPHNRTETLGFSQGISNYSISDESPEVAFPAAPGDLLVHHALTIHRADGNRSATRTRQSLGFIYYSAAAKEDAAGHAAYQEKLAADLVSQGKI